MLADFILGTLWAFIVTALIISLDMLFSLPGPSNWEEKQIEKITEVHHGEEHFHK